MTIRRLLLALLVATSGAACQPGGEAEAPDGRALFLTDTTPTCATCHVLQDAGSEGTIGPNLDLIRPSAPNVERAVREGPGAMPAYDALSDAEIEALAEYVARAAGS